MATANTPAGSKPGAPKAGQKTPEPGASKLQNIKPQAAPAAKKPRGRPAPRGK
jgi:hypothetical protein